MERNKLSYITWLSNIMLLISAYFLLIDNNFIYGVAILIGSLLVTLFLKIKYGNIIYKFPTYINLIYILIFLFVQNKMKGTYAFLIILIYIIALFIYNRKKHEQSPR